MSRIRQLRCLLCLLTAILLVLLTIPALLYREDATSRYSRQNVFMSVDMGEDCLWTEVQRQPAEPLHPDFSPTAPAAGALRFF